MTTTTFVDYQTPITAAWLNDVNAAVYSGILPSGGVTSEIKTATAGQTVFTLANSYGPGTRNLSVYINGIKINSTDYTETNSVTVTLHTGATVGDELEFVVLSAVSLGSTSANNVSYAPAGTGVTTTVQSKLRESVSVKDFGAVGDGVTDDTAAIQAALNTLVAGTNYQGNPKIRLPAGIYKVTSTLVSANSCSNYVFSGDGLNSTVINWMGGAGTAILEFQNARSVYVENMSIVNETANIPAYGIRIREVAGRINGAGVTGFSCTNLFIGSGLVDHIVKGIAYTSDLGSGLNNDVGIFTNVSIGNVQIGYSIDHLNSLEHRIYGGNLFQCSVAAFNTYQGNGTTCGGTFKTFGTTTGVCDIVMRLGPATQGQNIEMHGHTSEFDGAILNTPSPITAENCNVSIIGGSFKPFSVRDIVFDTTVGELNIVSTTVTQLGKISIPTSGPRVKIFGGGIGYATIEYNSYVRLVDVTTGNGTCTYTNLGSGILVLDHSSGTGQINSTPVTIANLTSFPVDGLSSEAINIQNTIATNISTLTKGIAGQTCTLYFKNSNNTLVNGTGAADTFRLRGAINVTPANLQNITVKYLLDYNTGNMCWHEISRNF
jgi:hypothetical protein